MSGEKILLGFVETNTENQAVCKKFINEFKDRGLRMDHEILFIIDGAKGLVKGIKDAMGKKALIQRCQWHKRENVVSYLDKKIKRPSVVSFKRRTSYRLTIKQKRDYLRSDVS